MNPTRNNPVAAAPAVPSALAPPQPHRPSTSCDRHPEERFTGFCPSCLFDRLSVLDIHTTVASSSSSSRKPPSSSAAALRSIFKPPSSSSVSSLFPELRRTKSFSARKNEALLSSGGFEPQRRSCDVRVRNTLWSLFNEDSIKEGALTVTEGTLTVKEGALTVKEGTLRANREIGLETRKPINCGNLKEQRSVIDEIVEEEEEETEKEKEQTEMMNPPQTTTTTKKPTRSFWSAASVLSKKLQKWRQKQKLKKHRSGAALPVEKSAVRQLRDTQSEVAEYGYGRRSCDTDPRFSIDAGRFSLDAGRVSVDDPRYSFDEPRASFDGYMIGRTAAAPPRVPSMLAVVEDSPVRNHFPVEEPPPPQPPRTPPESVVVPGGSEQTREYYNDSSSRRRKSLDRSSSTRKLSASIISEIDELKLSASNTKVSPPRDREVKDSTLHSRSHSSSVRGDCSVENVEMGGRENAGTVESSKRDTKKSKRWSWNIFGLLHRKNGNKCEDEEEEEGRSGVDRTFSGSWNVEARNGFDPKMMRSNSSVSWRSSATGGFQRNSVDGYVSGKKKKVSSSSSSVGRNVENGMLKFNITPSKGRRRGSMDSTSRPVPAAHPLARDVMNFY